MSFMIEDLTRSHDNSRVDNGCGIHTINCYLEAKYNYIHEQCATGISANGKGSKQTICVSNEIANVFAGIFAENITNVVMINNNQISYSANGISIINPRLISQFEIIENDPLTQLYSNSYYTPTGIFISGLKEISPNIYSKVVLNKLYNNENCIGFWIMDCERIGFQDNLVDISDLRFAINGFLVSNTQNSIFYNNTVSGVNYNGTNQQISGFDIIGSADNIYCNNHVSGLSYGFIFRGTCTSDNNFRSNTMINQNTGLALLAAYPSYYGATVMGIQEFKANEWNGT